MNGGTEYRDRDREGGWIQTYTGRRIWPLDPRPEEMHIADIAHALSMQCRYSGHCSRFYSVAEHSVLVARAVSLPNRLAALLHDASEAYLVDVPRPVKPYLANYQAAEERIMRALSVRFGFPFPLPKEVHHADCRILVDEKAQNMVASPHEWPGLLPLPLGVRLHFWTPDEAEAQFLTAYAQLA